MVNIKKSGCKNYKRPEIKVVDLDTTAILAQSGGTEGKIPDADFE